MVHTASSGFGHRLRLLRISHELSQSQLARAIGRHQTAIGPYERGEYMPARDIVDRMADVLGSSPEYLLFGRSPHRSQIEVSSELGPFAVARATEDRLDRTPLAIDDTSLVAYPLTDDTMAPAFRPGDYALVRRAEAPDLADLFGRNVMAEIADGREVLRQLWPSSTPDHYRLTAYNAPDWGQVAVVRAREVVGCLNVRALAG